VRPGEREGRRLRTGGLSPDRSRVNEGGGHRPQVSIRSGSAEDHEEATRTKRPSTPS
jgi:hypothetical protein